MIWPTSPDGALLLPESRSALRVTGLHPVFAAEVHDIDLSQPLSAGMLKRVNAAMNEFAVLIFRGQKLSAAQQITFAESFGPLDIGLKCVFKRPERLEDERLIDISNVDQQGNVAPAARTRGSATSRFS